MPGDVQPRESLPEAEPSVQPPYVVELLRRSRDLLSAGESVADPDWFDQANELTSEIEAALLAWPSA